MLSLVQSALNSSGSESDKVSNVTWDSKTLKKTINGQTTDIVTPEQILEDAGGATASQIQLLATRTEVNND